ncbi:hypothetical protein NA56DRAFT_648270 [Hyaloscypha hepaticicola]|uniref:Uncharacterized protein n=1 Tax=Hyaloscypha hepaticicola TaxID=2082293 RepID=A0A2J6PW38_9HELO|nr:hypothetical protein NA56DRAFT_648270 [Hyaloscypha hepaticicola]
MFCLPAILQCTCAQVAILTQKVLTVLLCRKMSLKRRYLTPVVWRPRCSKGLKALKWK